MPKKIFDIFPPQKTGEYHLSAGRETPVAKKEEERVEVPPKQKSQKISLKKWWGVVFLLFILGGFLAYFSLSRAEIEIWPETKISDFREKVTADSKVEKTDPAFWVKSGVIPAKIYEGETTLSQEFPASGKKEKRAEGIIKVYNVYSVSPQVLVANTRFVSAEGKLFRTIEKVTIPGGKSEGGKLVPGYLDIKVRADQPGTEYNIGPTTFSIPGFAGTPKYTAFYGKSFEKMEGGGQTSQVTKEDLENAKKILTERALEQAKTSLESKIQEETSSQENRPGLSNSDFVLIDKALSQEIISATSNCQEGAEAENFNLQVKVKSQALLFKKSDLENLAKELVSNQIEKTKKFQQESLKINYSAESIDLKSGRIILDLTINAKIYSEIDTTTLKKALEGKSLAETKILFESQPEIIKTRINLWPFWVKKVPENPEKIEIKINLDPVVEI